MLEKGNKMAFLKLKLLYIINYIGLPMTNSEITNYILEHNYMDYFTLQQILSELCMSKFIDIQSKNGNEYYKISEAGLATLEMFSDNLPSYFKTDVINNFSKTKKELKKQRELLGHYYKKSDNDFIVSFQVMENDAIIFNMSINVPSEELAKSICSKWNTNPEDIFSKILKTLTSD